MCLGHYETLGVTQNATRDEIRNAYWSQIECYHPDRFKGDPAVADRKMKQLGDAYQVLSDSERRRKYDCDLEYEAVWGGGKAEQLLAQITQDLVKEEIYDVKGATGLTEGAIQTEYHVPDAKERGKARPRLAILAGLVLFFLVMVGPLGGDRNGQLSLPAPAPERDTPVELVEEELPRNGKTLYTRHKYGDRNSPLTVSTKGKLNYYIKLWNTKTKETDLIFFVHGGRTVNTRMKAGTYELRYATGETWYGEEKLFGPDTVYQKADETFSFVGDKGWEVELYLQNDGNLGVISLRPEDF